MVSKEGSPCNPQAPSPDQLWTGRDLPLRGLYPCTGTLSSGRGGSIFVKAALLGLYPKPGFLLLGGLSSALVRYARAPVGEEGWEEAQSPQVLSDPQSHNDWRRKKLVYPFSRVHICLTFAGVGGFALDMASSQALTQGLPGPLSLLCPTRHRCFSLLRAECTGATKSWSLPQLQPLLHLIPQGGEGKREALGVAFTHQGRETQAFRELAPSHSLLKRTSCEILQKEQRQWSLDGGLPFCLARTVVGAGGSGADLAFR